MNQQGDPDLLHYLNKQLKISPPITSLEKQFQNGFMFQEVFLKSCTAVKNSQILFNKFEDHIVKKNFNVIGQAILKLNGVKPVITKEQSLIEEYLKIIKQHTKLPELDNMKLTEKASKGEMISLLTKTLQTKDKYQIQSFQNNYEEKMILSLPKKVQRIENKLQDFRDEKLLGEVKALKSKEHEEIKEREWLQSLREVELDKLKLTRQFQLDQDKRIYEFWSATEKVKHDRTQKDINLNQFLTQRIKNTLESQHQLGVKEFKDNLLFFTQNCIRQGIELKHDADRVKPQMDKAQFSAVATMMKIRDRTRKNEDAHKAREKRRNKMLVDQQKQQSEIETKKKEEALLDRYFEDCILSNHSGRLQCVQALRNELQTCERALREVEIQDGQMRTFEDMQKISIVRELELLPERKRQWRENQLHYMEINLNKKVAKREKHQIQIQAFVQSLLNLTEQCYIHQGTSQQIEFTFWRQLMEGWSGQHLEPILQIMDNQMGSISELGQSQEFFQYYCGGGEWRPTHFYLSDDKTMFNRPFINQELGEFLYDVVDVIHPKVEVKLAPQDQPTHLPLKISLIGGKFSGRKTLASYLNQKFGLEIINPEQIIKDALLEAFPPVEDEKDKKKKKETKKVEEVEKKENPQLKSLGQEIRQFQDKGEQLPDQLLIALILLKITQTFIPLNQIQLVQELQDAQQKEQQKQDDLIKQQQEVVIPKKVVAPPKKGTKLPEVVQQQEGQTKEEIIQTYLNLKPYFYTKGYVIIGFPETFNQARLLEETMTGYVPEEQRINRDAEKLKKKISELATPAQAPPSLLLIGSGLDLIINLQVPLEERLRRQQLRKIDPTTEIIYNSEENAPPQDVKGLNERLQPINDVQESKELFIHNDFRTLTQLYKQFHENLPELEGWLAQFGTNTQKGSKCLFHSLEITKGRGYEVAMKTDAIINDLFEDKSPHYRQMLEPQNEQQEEQNSSKLTIHQEMLDKSSCDVLIKQWLRTQHAYSQDITSHLKKMGIHRKKVVQQVIDYQKQLLEIYQCPDEKVTRLMGYQESYNKFLEENPDLSKQKNAKDELQRFLQILNERLWDILDKKKNESTQFLSNLRSSDWFEQEVKTVIQQLLMLFQSEANILGEVTEIIINARVLMKGVQVPDLGEHFILDPFDDSAVNEKLVGFDDETSPQMDYMFTYFIQQLDAICKNVQDGKEKYLSKRNIQINEKQTDALEERITQVLFTQKAIAIYRAHALRNIAISRIKEIAVLRQILYNRIDDWIIFGLKRENDFIYEAINYYKQCIHERKPANFSRVLPKEISESYHIILQNYNVNKPLLPSFEIQLPNRFRLTDWYLWSEELRSIADERGHISVAIFDQFYQRRLKSKQCESNLPEILLGLTGSQLQQKFPITNNKLSFQMIPLLICTLLLDSKLPDQSQIQEYLEELKEAEGEQLEEFCEVGAWYDDNESAIDQDTEMQVDRLFFVKRFIFESIRTTDQQTLNLQQFATLMKIFESKQTDETFGEFLVQ